MIKAILFDIDDTLLDFGKSEHKCIYRVFNELGLSPDDKLIEKYSLINKSQWKLLEKGLTTREKLLIERFRILFSEQGFNADAEDAQRLYEQYLSESVYYIDGALELLGYLKDKYKLFSVTNGNAFIQKKRLKISLLFDYFDCCFISEDIGFDKPSKEFFDVCFEEIKLDPSECILIGDSISSDIVGANKYGITSVLLTKNTDEKIDEPDYIVSSLNELIELLKKIEENNVKKR